jgi:hypothetical protein
MASASDLKKLSTCFVSGFFLHSAVLRLASLESHGAFLHAIAGYNATLMKLVFFVLSMVEIASTGALVLPILQHTKHASKIAFVCLVVASFVEAMVNFIAKDTNATTTSAFLFAACVVRLLEVSSSRSLSTYQGQLGLGSASDECLGKLRDGATRYKAASLCTLGIAFVVLYTLHTTDAFWKQTSTLRRNLAIARWQKSASFVSLLAAVGSSDTSKRRIGIGSSNSRKAL